jgi:fibronectin type 3 domain-containing protein
MAVSLIAGLASAIGYGLSLEVFAFSWAYFALGAGLSLVSRALAPKLDIGAQMGGQSVMTREAASSRKIIYGRARVGGNVVYLESTGDDNKYLWLVTAIAGHEIDAFEEVWFNDKKIWDGGNFTSAWATTGNSSTSPYVDLSFHLGNQTAVDSGLDNASTKWTSNHILLDTAYMVVKLTYDQEQFAQGLPNISTVIRGKKVYDAQKDSTSAYYEESLGVSTQREGDASTWQWSQNPALCVRDYLTDTKYGLGESASNILASSIDTATDVCNEAVDLAAGGTQPRYTMDGVVDTANSIKANIENMVGSMIGRLVYSGGKFEIHAGEYVAPTVTIDESMMIGEISVQTKQSRRSAYNGVKGVFLSEEDNYILADYPAQISSTYAAQDGDPIYLDMPLPYTVNNVRAQRIAQLALRRSRQQESITIPCNLNALKFKIGDNISVTNTRLGYSAKVFEVVGYSMGFSSDQMVVNVDAIETASSIWSWDEDEEVFLGAGEVDIYDGTSTTAPASITVTADTFISSDGTSSASFDVSWPTSVDAFVDHYVVEWKVSTDSSYFSQSTKTAPLKIVGLDPSKTYDVRLKAVNGLAVSSSYVSAQAVPAADTTAPSVPTSISAVGVYAQINLSWTNPTQKDLSHINIYKSSTNTGTYAFLGSTDGTTFQDGDLADEAEFFYQLKSVDKTGNISNPSSSVNATTRTIPSSGIADGAIGTSQLADDAITNDKIADDAVNTAQIVDDAVTNALIATDAVNQGSIAANAVTASEIATNAVTAIKILAGSITTAKIDADAVTAAKISVDDLSAINADLGTITAGSIDGVTIKIGSGESVFKADTNGIYLGNETFANAEFRVSPSGAVTATSATISGDITATSGSIANGVTIGGTAASTVTSGAAAGATALQDADTGVDLGLTGGSISGITISATKLYEGTGTFNNANTGFYLDDTGQFSLKDKLSFNGTDLTIDGNGTFSGAITATSGSLSSLAVSGAITVGTSGKITGGTSTSFNTGSGFFLGYDTNAYKFSIGDASTGKNLTWDGTDIKIGGAQITAPDNPDVVIYDGSSGLPPSVTNAVAKTSSDTNTFYLKQNYKEHLEIRVSYPVGALTSGTVSGETNAINAVMSQFKFQIYYAPVSDPTNFTQFGPDLISARQTTTGQLIGSYLVKTTDLGSGNYKAELQTKTEVETAYPTLSGYQLGVIDDDYNLTKATTVYDFPSGEYVFKVVVTVTDGSYSPYPATGSPSSTLSRTVKAVGYQQVQKSGYSYAFEPYYQPTTIFRDGDSDEVVRLSNGADTLELSAINAQGKPRLLMIGPNTTNPSSGVSWGASINFVTSFDSYTNGGTGNYQIGIDKSGTGLYLGSGGYRPQDSGGSELKITNGRTDVFGTLFLNGTQITGTGSASQAESYPLSQQYDRTLTTTSSTVGSFSIPAPDSAISKRQGIDISVLFEIANAGKTAQALSSIDFVVEKKSKGVNAVTVGTVTLEGLSSVGFQQIISVSGNQLGKVDMSGGIAASATASGTNEPSSIYSVYYDSGANKTFLLCNAQGSIFSTGDTLYYSDSKFTASGTWFAPSDTEVINSITPPDPDVNYVNASTVSSGTGTSRFYMPYKMTYGKTTTATDYRIKISVSSIPSGITYKVIKMFGSIQNIA